MSLALVPKLTGKQEKFCTFFIQSGNASEAYRQSYRAEKMGSSSICVEASRKLNHPKISLRLEQLRAHHAKRHEVTVESMTNEYFQALNMAKEMKIPAVMIKAITALAKLHGLLVERKIIEKESVRGNISITFVDPPPRPKDSSMNALNFMVKDGIEMPLPD